MSLSPAVIPAALVDSSMYLFKGLWMVPKSLVAYPQK